MEKLKSPRLSYSFVAKLPLKSLYSKISNYETKVSESNFFSSGNVKQHF